MKALLRRTLEDEAVIIRIDELILDDMKHQVTIADKPVELTYKEYELCRMLMQNIGNAIPREKFMTRIWGADYEGESRTLDMHIKTLRKKLGDQGSHIKTVRNVGYRMEE